MIHFRCAEPPTANPDKYADEFLRVSGFVLQTLSRQAYLFVEDADAPYAEYAARGVEFTRELGNMLWRWEFVVKDCDGRRLLSARTCSLLPSSLCFSWRVSSRTKRGICFSLLATLAARRFEPSEISAPLRVLRAVRWVHASEALVTMNQAQRNFCRALLLSCMVFGYASPGFGQTSNPKSSAIIDQIMTTALSRCYSSVNGIKAITFVPATNQEIAEVKALGQDAIAPLARYLDLQPEDGFTQLFAITFLMTIGGPSSLGPLKGAFAQDQWEVTRDVALSGIFAVSPAEAKPYVEAALRDRSHLVRRTARHLWRLYRQQNK